MTHRSAETERVGLTARLQSGGQFQFVAFCANGLACALIYSAAVWTLVALSRRTFALDVVAAYALTAVCNYLGARLVFKPETTLRGHLSRYVTVVAANFLTTALLAWFLHRTDSPDIVAAYLPVALTALPTFFILRAWVFGHPSRVDS